MQNKYSIKPLLNPFNRGTIQLVEILGGTPPFTWSVTGSDLSFTDNTTNVRYNFLTASESSELNNTEEITVTDTNGAEVTTYCVVCGATICCDDPDYSFTFNLRNKTSVVEGRSIRIGVNGGCPPYTWSIISGTGFSFPIQVTNSRYNYLHYDNNVDGLCVFTVTDGCENTASVDIAGQALCDPPCPDGDTILGKQQLPGGECEPPCKGEGYSFYWQSEETIEIWEGSNASVVINGGKSAVILKLSNPIDFSFESVDGGIDEYYCAGNSTIGVTIYGASKKGGTGTSTLTATDGCLLTPVYPTGTGMINLKLLVCCEDLPDGEFAFDDGSTPDTIVKNSSITVYVTGGCPPFTFATSSLGYTFNGGVQSYETNNRFVTLSCVNGTCGTNFAVTCSLTITDDCNSIVSVTIRNTSGKWSGLTNVCGSTGGSRRYANPVGGMQYIIAAQESCSNNYYGCGESCVSTIISQFSGVLFNVNSDLQGKWITFTCGVAQNCSPAGNKLVLTEVATGRSVYVSKGWGLGLFYRTWIC